MKESEMSKKLFAHRYHDFSYGHRVVGHEGKCQNLHGHNGRVTFFCSAPNLDSVGRVIDFSVIKSTLVKWVEENWDHKMLIWEEDPLISKLIELDPTVVSVPFNPTAENISNYLIDNVAPELLKDSGVELYKVEFMETRKCGCTLYKS